MISQDLQALIPRFLKTTRIIWMAFLAAPPTHMPWVTRKRLFSLLLLSLPKLYEHPSVEPQFRHL